jgi:hypothetical protein
VSSTVQSLSSSHGAVLFGCETLPSALQMSSVQTSPSSIVVWSPVADSQQVVAGS